jgi:hypothetical protein
LGKIKKEKDRVKTCTYIITEGDKGMKNSNRQKVREGGGADNQALSPLFTFIITASRLFASYIFSATSSIIST